MEEPVLTCAWCGGTFERRSPRGPAPQYCCRQHQRLAAKARRGAVQHTDHHGDLRSHPGIRVSPLLNESVLKSINQPLLSQAYTSAIQEIGKNLLDRVPGGTTRLMLESLSTKPWTSPVLDGLGKDLIKISPVNPALDSVMSEMVKQWAPGGAMTIAFKNLASPPVLSPALAGVIEDFRTKMLPGGLLDPYMDNIYSKLIPDIIQMPALQNFGKTLVPPVVESMTKNFDISSLMTSALGRISVADLLPTYQVTLDWLSKSMPDLTGVLDNLDLDDQAGISIEDLEGDLAGLAESLEAAALSAPELERMGDLDLRKLAAYCIAFAVVVVLATSAEARELAEASVQSTLQLLAMLGWVADHIDSNNTLRGLDLVIKAFLFMKKREEPPPA